MNTTLMVIVIIVIIIIALKRSQDKQINDNLRYIIKSLNDNPEILTNLSYNDLVELEEILTYYNNQGQSLVPKIIYDRLKVELSKKKS